MSQKLIILGSNGMLGQMVKKYFETKNFDVTCFDQRFEVENRVEYADFLGSLQSGCVINCIGKIRQKTNDATALLSANTILPAELRSILHEDVILIHPSTDCVFNGKMGSAYPADHAADAEEEYGWSKRLGEVVLEGRPNTLCAPGKHYIGPDKNPNGKGLLAWAASNPPGTEIKGFLNHLWNGITTLEWCKQVDLFLQTHLKFDFKLIQFGTSEYYSKFVLLQKFNQF